uniref:BED-type domain-containing protein n=1 Tax=Sinocyclocheilus anshuiensis TaxID=1608454 RepID=A0A671L3S2_9TELE
MANSKMTTRKTSKVWDYFELEGNGKVLCKLCNVKLAYNNSTGAMRNHIQYRHVGVRLDLEASQSQQMSVTSFTTTRRRCDPVHAEKITELISEMISRDLLPLSFVEGEGFRKLMDFVEPEYRVPGRKMITSRLELVPQNMLANMKKTMEKTDYVAITTDCWTSLKTEAYMTIMCHFIIEGELKSSVLQTRTLDERHTAENLAEHLRTAISNWGLNSKVTACVHNNASNIVLANKDLEWESVACFAHTLQLAVTDGFKANTMTRHFHHSTVATVALKKKQEQQALPQHTLIQSCKTRWNSRWAVAAVLSDRSVTKLSDARTLELSDENWMTIETMLPILESLKSATTALCSETYVSVSMVLPVTMSLLNRHLCPEAGDSNKVAEFKGTVAASLERRISTLDTEKAGSAAQLASALDPRHKHLSFLQVDMQQAVRDKIASLYQSLPSNDDENSGTVNEDGTSTPKQKKICLRAFFGYDYGESMNEDELELYWKEPSIPLNEDPLRWWCGMSRRFPKLYRLACRYRVPATSVPSERVFSSAGIIVNRLRSRLSPDHVDVNFTEQKSTPEPQTTSEASYLG